jgi:hypothetical protein
MQQRPFIFPETAVVIQQNWENDQAEAIDP